MKLKNFLKKSIWLHHWKADISSALTSNSLFAPVFLTNKSPPTHPYKGHAFLTSLHTQKFSRTAIARILRFWLTPARVRVCTCSTKTHNLARHLLFFCSNTQEDVNAYAANLETLLLSCFTQSRLLEFLRIVACSEKLLINFNLLVGTFRYPRY